MSQYITMSLAEPEPSLLARQLSWDVESDIQDSVLSQGSDDSHGSSESINEQIEEVTSDLKDMLREVEVLKRSSVIYDSMKDMTGMIEDVGRMSRRNSELLADDFDVFSLEESPNIKVEEPEKKRYSSHLTPDDALRSERFPPRIRHCRSMEVLTDLEHSSSDERERVGLVYQGRQTLDLEEEIRSANPWQAEEKVGGIAYTLKVSPCCLVISSCSSLCSLRSLLWGMPGLVRLR